MVISIAQYSVHTLRWHTVGDFRTYRRPVCCDGTRSTSFGRRNCCPRITQSWQKKCRLPFFAQTQAHESGGRACNAFGVGFFCMHTGAMGRARITAHGACNSLILYCKKYCMIYTVMYTKSWPARAGS